MASKCRSKGKNKNNEIIDDLSDVDLNIREKLKEKLQIYSEINKISADDEFYNPSSSSEATCACKQINMINMSKGNTLKIPLHCIIVLISLFY